jgi:hypothetical protein
MAVGGDYVNAGRLTPQIVASSLLCGASEACIGTGICSSSAWIEIFGMGGEINAGILEGNSHRRQ